MVFSDLAGFRSLRELLFGRRGWDLLACHLRVLGVWSVERGGYKSFPGRSLDSTVASSVLECDTLAEAPVLQRRGLSCVS